MGQDVARAGVEGGDGVSREIRAKRGSRRPRLPPGGLWLYHLHRQFRAIVGTGGAGGRGGRSGRRRGVVGQPQFRGARASAGARQLSRLAAAGGRLCARRLDAGRSHPRAARPRRRRPRRPSARHLAVGARGRRRRGGRGRAGHVRRRLWRRVFRRRRMARDRRAGGRDLRLAGVDLCPQPALFHRRGGAPGGRHRERAGSRVARRLGHHRPYFARRRHRPRKPGRRLARVARRRAGGLQFLRRAARQPRDHVARDLRQCPPAQRTRARNRRRVDPHRRRRPSRDRSRGGARLRRARDAAGRRRGPGIRNRIVARLGRQGADAAGRAGRHRRKFRAHSPRQSGRHGRSAAGIHRRRDAPRPSPRR